MSKRCICALQGNGPAFAQLIGRVAMTMPVPTTTIHINIYPAQPDAAAMAKQIEDELSKQPPPGRGGMCHRSHV